MRESQGDARKEGEVTAGQTNTRSAHWDQTAIRARVCARTSRCIKCASLVRARVRVRARARARAGTASECTRERPQVLAAGADRIVGRAQLAASGLDSRADGKATGLEQCKGH